MLRLLDQPWWICCIGFRSINKIEPENVFFVIRTNVKTISVIGGIGNEFATIELNPILLCANAAGNHVADKMIIHRYKAHEHWRTENDGYGSTAGRGNYPHRGEPQESASVT